jgi:hypothetical protein
MGNVTLGEILTHRQAAYLSEKKSIRKKYKKKKSKKSPKGKPCIERELQVTQRKQLL